VSYDNFFLGSVTVADALTGGRRQLMLPPRLSHSPMSSEVIRKPDSTKKMLRGLSIRQRWPFHSSVSEKELP